MASSSSTKKMITLKSSDGEAFEVEEAVAMESKTIKHMIEDNCTEGGIVLPLVNGKTLAKVIDYMKKHSEVANPADGDADHRPSDEDMKSWDAEFVKVDQDALLDITLAADYLDIKNLLDLACQTTADMIKDLSPEEVRTIFNIDNDFTPEEEQKLRHENAWAFG